MKNVLIFFLGVCLSLPMLQAQTTVSFAFTGALQTWTVPSGVTAVTVVAKGAKGGNLGFNLGGNGGRVQALLTVTPGQVLNIYVGGAGGGLGVNGGGYNGGGSSVNDNDNGTGGGGATDIRINGFDLTDRVVVAGGGGGGAQSAGGAGGGTTGASGETLAAAATVTGGEGGTPSAGGAAGSPSNGAVSGSLGQGGNGNGGGSGGGAGYYGGGAGGSGVNGNQSVGGGGGSSYTSPTLCSSVAHSQGDNAGEGSLTITYAASCNCDPTCSSLPTTVGTYTATTTNVIGAYTHYCNGSGALLMSIKTPTNSTAVPAAAVKVKVGATAATFYSRYCGGTTAATSCFMTTLGGGVLINRTWHIDSSLVTGPVISSLNLLTVVSYFTQGEYTALNSALTTNSLTALTAPTSLIFYVPKPVYRFSAFVDPSLIKPTGAATSWNNGTTPSLMNWKYATPQTGINSAELQLKSLGNSFGFGKY